MEDNNEPEPMQLIQNEEEQGRDNASEEHNEDESSENSDDEDEVDDEDDNDDEEDDDDDDEEEELTNSENEHDNEPILRSIRRIENVLQYVRNPLRAAQRNLDRLGFLRGRLGGHDNDNDMDDDDGTVPENAEKFDTDLPAEHSYLGSSMVRVSGVNYLEPDKDYRLLILMHHSMLFPGEALPMIIPEFMFDSSLFPGEGILFGVVFPNIWKMTKPELYGVTCQIYEKGNDATGNVILKSRAHQRFIITKHNNPNFSDLLKPHQRKIYAHVRILPEIYLPDPLSSINLGSMNRFRDIKSMSHTLSRMQASTTAWPQFVYKQYDVAPIIQKAKEWLYMYKITSMPNDMVLLSFWLAKNILLDLKKRIKVFLTNSVNIRMKIIEKALDAERFFCCRRCKNKIANGHTLFAMSKHGVQSNYCNPSGFIHETNTVYSVLKNSVYPTGTPSTEFSWFPGYSWQIVLCRMCDTHIGWKFTSTKSNLIPKKFYGLSGTNIIIDVAKNYNTDDEERQQHQQNSSSGGGGGGEASSSNSNGNEPYLVLYGSTLDAISDD